MDRGNEVRSRERCRRRVSEKCKTGEVRRQSERDVRSLETKSIQRNALPNNLDSGGFNRDTRRYDGFWLPTTIAIDPSLLMRKALPLSSGKDSVLSFE